MPCSTHTLLAYWGLTTTAWVVMWLLLGTMSVLLIFLLRTRWSTKRTWQKCAILSLWVHVLLAFISMTIRVVTGAPESGDATPIHVAVLPAERPLPQEPVAETATEEEPEELPDWEQPVAPPLVPPQAEPPLPTPEPDIQESPDSDFLEELLEDTTEAAPSPALPLEAPSLLAAPETQPLVVEDPANEQAAKPVPPANEKPATEKTKEKTEHSPIDHKPTEPTPSSESNAIQMPKEQPSDEPDAELVSTPARVNHSDVPERYADRFATDLTELASQRGGSEQTEQAVRAALGWLASAQSSSGGWDASRFGAGQERVVLGHDRRGAGANADTAMTSLAILAFLGTGNTHLHGDYRNEVARALEYLRQHQRSDGSLYGDAQLFARTYCHSMAALAICEAFAMTRDPRLESPARAATAYSLSLQHPTDGGWRYRRGDTGDTSQLGWQLMALKSAQLAGIEIPEVTWTRVERFLRRVRRGTAGGLAAYRPDGPPSRTMTAEAWFCHQLLSDGRPNVLGDDATREALMSLNQELPSASNRNLYYWYYATLALQQNQEFSEESASAWEAWNHALTTVLLSTQSRDGSWNEATTWGGYGGRVYTTAVSALCLEVYYRYKPTPKSDAIAERGGWQSMR